MKKCIALVLLALVPLLAYGCGGGSPSDVAKAFYKAGNAGNYSEAESYLSFEARASYKQPLFGVAVRFDNQMDAVTKAGTITRIDVEEGKDYGGYAVVLVTLHYANGGQASDTLSLLKEDGRWRIVISTLLLTAQSKPTPSPTPTLTPTPRSTATPMPSPEKTTVRKVYSMPPKMAIDVNKVYRATLHTAKGDIVVDLFPKKAPKTVNNFVFLARDGFYSNTVFHRVIEDFVAQGGDPTGTGRGSPGYTFEDEFSDLVHDAGVISMANAGPNTNGSQFFITYTPQHHLDGKHSVFGKVVRGMDVAQALVQGDALSSVDIEELP